MRLPGVTVTATSPALLSPVIVVSDETGFYRVINLPPGTYVLTAELSGFSVFKRTDLVVRAGLTIGVDIEMAIGSLTETVTVSGETPMLEVAKPTSVVSVDGTFLKTVPITSRRAWSDALDFAPGVGSRQTDSGDGQMGYYFHGADIFSHAFQLEGAPASSYTDAAAKQMGMSRDTVEDIEVKLGGVDASAPLSTGIVVNIVTPRGGNQLKGSIDYMRQPASWNSDNASAGSAGGGVPTLQGVNMVDGSLGGPVLKDRVWFYGSVRYSSLINGISRTADQIATLKAFRPDVQLLDNTTRTFQPFFKITAQLGKNHELTGYFQNDASSFTTDLYNYADRISYDSTGGSIYHAKVSSVWSNSLVTSFSASYNNKSGKNEHTFDDLDATGPQIRIHRTTSISGGRPVGSGELVRMGNIDEKILEPASMLVFRGDLTYYKSGWLGSHEFRTGIYAAPALHYDITTNYVNDGFNLEERRQIDPNNPAAGTVAFHRTSYSPSVATATSARDRDIGIYLQDSWRPHPRITWNLGVRADFVRRFDDVFQIERMKSVAIGPRTGISWQLTRDARNVLRASYGRVHEQVNGRDRITTFGSATNALVESRDLYDANGDGVFETTIITPRITQTVAKQQFDPDLHQPWVDEFIVGYRRQFPGQVSVDISGIRRYYKDNFARVDINGIYPDGPYKPFVGFGKIDPNRGIVEQQTNRTWATIVYSAIELVVAKNMSHHFQLMGSVTRQWGRMDGTWNPTDPARFIQPDAFPNTGYLGQSRGNEDQNTLTSSSASGAGWRPYSVRFGGTWLAPWSLVFSGSYIISGGDYSGPILTRRAAADPIFGPSQITLANGTRQSNPLATTNRFAYATRGEGQVLNTPVRYLQVKVGREFAFGRHTFEIAGNVFNVFNAGDHAQWASGANRQVQPGDLPHEVQPAGAARAAADPRVSFLAAGDGRGGPPGPLRYRALSRRARTGVGETVRRLQTPPCTIRALVGRAAVAGVLLTGAAACSSEGPGRVAEESVPGRARASAGRAAPHPPAIVVLPIAVRHLPHAAEIPLAQLVADRLALPARGAIREASGDGPADPVLAARHFEAGVVVSSSVQRAAASWIAHASVWSADRRSGERAIEAHAASLSEIPSALAAALVPSIGGLEPQPAPEPGARGSRPGDAWFERFLLVAAGEPDPASGSRGIDALEQLDREVAGQPDPLVRLGEGVPGPGRHEQSERPPALRRGRAGPARARSMPTARTRAPSRRWRRCTRRPAAPKRRPSC